MTPKPFYPPLPPQPNPLIPRRGRPHNPRLIPRQRLQLVIWVHSRLLQILVLGTADVLVLLLVSTGTLIIESGDILGGDGDGSGLAAEHRGWMVECGEDVWGLVLMESSQSTNSPFSQTHLVSS